ncbi:MAG: type 1 glutamine amidotransferase [Pseudomonadota bacterium]
MKIGILQTGTSPDELKPVHGDYDDLFKRLLANRGFSFDTYRVFEGNLPEKPDSADGWLITGSKYGVYEDHPWIPPLEAFLRRAFSEGVPIVGVCFGHQLLAQALGGKVEKFSGGWSVGPADYETMWGGQDRVYAWHQDQVIELPEGAETIASSSFCEHAMVTYGDRALTVQPHPEFTADFFADLFEARGDILPDEVKAAAQPIAPQPLTSPRFTDLFEDFFKRSRP